MSVEAHSSDVDTLHRMGYAQELLRRMSGFSNFAVSFTIISILSGCLTLFYFGMSNGGPAVINIGWPLVGVMVILVGLAMAEVCSSYPTAGGLYYWAAKLGGKSSAGWSWITGWFNLLGQVAVTAGIDFGLAFFVNYFLSLFGVIGQKSYAQVLATAFAVFTTTNSLNTGTTSRSLATKYGFTLSNTGTGATT